jgi:hypothetical protein
MVLAALYFAVALFWFYLAWKGPSTKVRDFLLRTHFKIWYGWDNITDALPAIPKWSGGQRVFCTAFGLFSLFTAIYQFVRHPR